MLYIITFRLPYFNTQPLSGGRKRYVCRHRTFISECSHVLYFSEPKGTETSIPSGALISKAVPAADTPLGALASACRSLQVRADSIQSILTAGCEDQNILLIREKIYRTDPVRQRMPKAQPVHRSAFGKKTCICRIIKWDLLSAAYRYIPGYPELFLSCSEQTKSLSSSCPSFILCICDKNACTSSKEAVCNKNPALPDPL